ncbi:MAG: polyribonucleotide nucleotidyltransferase [Myxococcota bacterium]|nr:polyribonucleotide nucleotidyltransferase [Myxococcota bacterium]
MNIVEKSIDIGGATLTLQTGKIAKQASGAILISAGGTSVLVTAQGAKEKKEGIDFLPLTVDYQEKMSAAGRIPGGFFKREGRLRESETLISRIIDRSIRPLFAEGWGAETQVIATVFSADPEHPADTLAMTGASTALTISDMPFLGPIAGIRVCRVDGEFLVNPSYALQGEADLNLFIASSKEAIIMVEGGADQVSEEVMIDALLFAHEQAQPLIELQLEMQKEAGLTKREVSPDKVDEELAKRVEALCMSGIQAAYDIKEKLPRYAALDDVKKNLKKALITEAPELADRSGEISAIFGDLKYKYVRQRIVKDNYRIDGRGPADIRGITTETGVLERTHGSSLFTRGETQAIVTTTLGTRQDEQRIDGLRGDTFENFMLHYNFPPYSVGETRFLRGPGRREIGHGSLAHRALKPLVQFGEDFPYTIRIVSDITESNGSSSMATVCGGSMALMDAGVPMQASCAGIAMGLIQEGDDMVILSDILGDEDHLGDMDFKVAGSEKGITAIQMDIKITGVTREVLETALSQARDGRLHILKEMSKTLGETRDDLSAFAPRITTLRISTDRIRDVIGPGGKVIKDIIARTGCQVEVLDDGTVNVASSDGESGGRAIQMIKDLTREAEIGKTYLGTVRKVADFGAFVEIFPGTEGLCHISELADRHIKNVEDVVQEGDEVVVKCIGLDKGRIRLSRKEAQADEKKAQAAKEAEAE